MLRRTFLTVALLIAMPAIASATWYVTASASKSADDTTSRVKPAGSTAIPGYSGFKNISTIAGNGFQVNRVTLDGVTLCQTPLVSGKPLCVNSTFYMVSYQAGKTYRTLTAYFGPATIPGYAITVTPPANSSYSVISPVNGSLTNIPKGESRTIALIPLSGYAVNSVAIGGPGAGACTVSDSGQFAGAKNIACVNIQDAITIGGTTAVSQTVTANAGPARTVNGAGPGSAITLNGSATYIIGPVTYAWSAIGANAAGAHFGNPAAASTTFYADAPGTYSVQLIATAAGPTVSAPAVAVITVMNHTDYLESLCSSCHSSRNTAVVADYDTSKHKTTTAQVVACQTCHDPTNTGHYTVASPVGVCAGCHTDNSGNVPAHPFAIGAYACTTCHNAHSTAGTTLTPPTALHYNNVTSAGYPASYVTSRAACADCHYGSPANLAIRQQWYTSGHARVTGLPWTRYDFKTMSGCVQCHTTTGFKAYSTGKVTAAWGDGADKTKELLTCIGCHSDITTGVVRTVSPVKPFANDPYTNRNVGESNICMDCHSGRNNGLSIVSADFANQPFISPHYLAAGGTLHGKAGYHFPGQTYAFYSTNTHRTVGIGNSKETGTDGPCVSCHKNAAFGHTFKSGVVSICANCHGSSLASEQLDAGQAAYVNGLNVLKAELDAKGYVYIDHYPYFNNTGWGSGQAGADTMGAAFNYVLLLKEPGAYTHNSAYAKKLIVDSIDYLHNGTITGSIDGALASLVNSGKITQAEADNLQAYKAATSCTFCHGNATGSHPAHLNDGFSCADCHNATAATNTSLVPGTATHVNGLVNVVIAPVNNGSGGVNYNAPTCSGITCHASGAVSWGSGPAACESCHTGTLSVINGTTAPDKSLATTRGHGKAGINQPCLNCHDRNQRHRGGTGMLQSAFTGMLNTECNYCHNNAEVIPDAGFRNMSTHFTKNGGQAACADCHDLHGTTNLSMIRTSIIGQTITCTDRSTGWINTTTNMGLCQVCHTATSHYRAGVPETQHPTANCFSCHPHNAGGGAFMPRGTCDACHGYPPAPRLVTASITFGIMNNWSSARFEDYSGGGRRAPGRAAHRADGEGVGRLGQLRRMSQRRRDGLGPLSQNGVADSGSYQQRPYRGRSAVPLQRRLRRLHRRQAGQPAGTEFNWQLLQRELPYGLDAALEHRTLISRPGDHSAVKSAECICLYRY